MKNPLRSSGFFVALHLSGRRKKAGSKAGF